MRWQGMSGVAAWWLLVLLTVPGGPAVAQQNLSDVPQVVRVENLDQVLGALRQVEQKLDMLLASRWEYRSVQRSLIGEDVEDVIARLGQQGWELVGVTVEEGFLLKRRVLPR